MSLLSFLRGAALVGTVLLISGATVKGANAATFVVTSTADTPGDVCGTDCSLPQAINAANANGDADSIVFDSTVFATKKTIFLSYGLPDIRTDMTITGPTAPGAGVTIHTNDSTTSTIFRMNGGAVTLAHLAITGAATAFIVSRGNVTLSGCTLADNVTGILNASFQHSRRPDEAPGLVTATWGDLLLDEYSTVTLNNCTISGSKYGIYNLTGLVELDSCTVTGNEVGLVNQDGVQKLSNCLVVGNSRSNMFTDARGKGSFSPDQHSITKGTATEAGLDPKGLQENGGPTPTIALLTGSAAIGAGTATLAVDQRGFARTGTKAPDIGAFQTQSSPTKLPS